MGKGDTLKKSPFNRRKDPGRLDVRNERLARAIANPANFGELVLGYKFYPKQRKALEMCMEPGAMVSIACCNGGGKTSRILPTLVLWHQYLWPGGKCKVTSGSYPQIEDQIYPAIQLHKDRFPQWKWLETPYFESRDTFTGRIGFFRGFTTNHPGRAEGDHPDGDECPLMFIVDEAKTSPDWLRKVLEGRVRPTRLILMSSHGFASGWFYESQRLLGDKFKCITISAEDCSHITTAEIDQIKKDFAGQPEFVDAVLGHDFIPMVEDAAINGRALDELLANPPHAKPDGEVHAFCDFAWSGSGDENVLAVRRGNVVAVEKAFHSSKLEGTRRDPTPGIVDIFISEFIRLGLESTQISGDESGGGKLVIDALEQRGWYINRVYAQARANDSEHYANAGAELWFEGGKLITTKSIVIPNDLTLRMQLLSRKRMRNDKGKLMVEPKDQMKKRNVASPDRADAVLGAMAPCGGYSGGGMSWAMPVGIGQGWASVGIG